MKAEEIQPFANMIDRYAWVTLGKVKKPTMYSHPDLVNEGIALLIEVKEKLYDPKRGSSLKTYFTRLLRKHFGDMVKRSYSCHTWFPNEERARNFTIRFRKKFTYQDPSDIADTKILLEKFTSREEKYASTMIQASGTSMKTRRQEAREALDLTVGQENVIRKGILTKIHS